MSAIVRPNAARCFTYSTAYMSAPSARPMPRAATIGRIELRPSIASRKPPTSPTTFAAGTRTSSRISSPVSTPRTPILSSVRPTETPGHERSTMKHEMSSCLRESAGPVLANTQYQSACTTPDIQHFVPLSTQSSPSRTALVRMPTTSLPACGSESPKPARMLAGRDRRARSAASAPRCPRSAPGPVGRRVSSSISAAVFEYFATSSIASVRPRIPAPAAAVLLGDHEPEQAGVAEELEEVLRVRRRSVSISRARGATFSCASLRTVAWSSANSGGRSNAIGRRAYRPPRRKSDPRGPWNRGFRNVGQWVHWRAPGRHRDDDGRAGPLPRGAGHEHRTGRARRRRHRRRTARDRTTTPAQAHARSSSSAGVVAVLAVAAIAVALAARDDSNGSRAVTTAPPASSPDAKSGGRGTARHHGGRRRRRRRSHRKPCRPWSSRRSRRSRP